MATINLRPWREERKERLKKEFGQMTVVFVIIAVVIWLGWNRAVTGMVDNQKSRNVMLEKEIASLDEKVKEIQELKDKKADLIDRMRVIQDLQGTRPLIVHLFDQIAKTIPDGVFFTNLKRTGDKIFIKGTAESNTRVSNLMRALDEAKWFDDPNLTKVQKNEFFGPQGNDFELAIDVVKPEDRENEESAE